MDNVQWFNPRTGELRPVADPAGRGRLGTRCEAVNAAEHLSGLTMAKRNKKPTMIEVEWLANENPVPMVEFVRTQPRASPRVLRLFLAAFWAWQVPRLKTATEQRRLRGRVKLVKQWAESGKQPEKVAAEENTSVVFFNADAGTAAFETARAPTYWGERGKEATAIQPHFLREIFGPYPFRKVVADPAWLTSTVLTLAEGIYKEEAFDRMPILADALQDAGCGDEELLSHCRDTAVMHVRGCWVLDLLLGKG